MGGSGSRLPRIFDRAKKEGRVITLPVNSSNCYSDKFYTNNKESEWLILPMTHKT